MANVQDLGLDLAKDTFTAPDGQSVGAKDLVGLYRDLVKTPLPTSGILVPKLNGQLSLRVTWSSRDVELLERDKFAQYHTIATEESGLKVTDSSEPFELGNEAAVAVSKSGKLRAVLRSKKVDGKDKQFVDIWDLHKVSKVTTFDLEKLDAHGDVRASFPFGQISFSPDEQAILYTAEQKKKSKAESFFKRNLEKTNGKDDEEKKDSSKDSPRYGEEYLYEEDWGEALDGIAHTVAAVLNLVTRKVTIVEVPNVSVAEPFWIGQDNSAIGFVGWEEFPKRLGLIYCTNRTSKLYKATVSDKDNVQTSVLVGDDGQCVRSPRISPSGQRVVYLDNTHLGPHHKASRLILLNFKDNSKSVLVDTDINESQVVSRNLKLKALYIFESLPRRCWTPDEKHVLLHTITHNYHAIFGVDTESKVITQLPFPLDCCELLDIQGNVLVAIGQSVNVVPSVFVGKFGLGMTWMRTTEATEENVLEELDYSVDVFPSKAIDDFPVHAILVGPTAAKGSSSPVVVLPHGGPHSSFFVAFMRYCVLFAKLGFKSLLVNYRGSVGVDEDSVHSLLGQVGHFDVKDVVSAINFYADKGLIDTKKMVLFGGSHGGFLVTHLSGQFADLDFVACICRNPVIDVACMTECSDIPDWCWTETIAAENYSFTKAADADILKIMFDRSPLAHVDKVKTPTLVMLGKKDRRVPMSQGLKWYHALRARGVDTRCHVYDDKHDLQKVEVDSDVFLNTMLWILKHMNK